MALGVATVSILCTAEARSSGGMGMGARPISVADVEQAMASAGIALRVGATSTIIGTATSLVPMNQKAGALPNYAITVFGAGAERIGRVYGPKDDRGVWWSEAGEFKGSPNTHWAGAKWYRNVRLTWWSKTKRTNALWADLDRILEALSRRR